MNQELKVTTQEYADYADFIDKRAMDLMLGEKSKEYSADNDDHLALENRISGLIGKSPEEVALYLAAKHIAGLCLIFEKNDVFDVPLDKVNERIADCCNLLKIAGAFAFCRHSGQMERTA